MLNVQAFGDDDLGTGASLAAEGKAAFTGSDRLAILSVASRLAAFNQRGDARPLPPSVIPGPADRISAQNIADRAFRDTCSESGILLFPFFCYARSPDCLQ